MHYTFYLTYGNLHFQGQHHISVAPSGAYVHRTARGETTEEKEGILNGQQLEVLAQAIDDADVCEMVRSRPGVPGEDILEFRIMSDDTDCKGEAWSNDAQTDLELKQLMDVLRKYTN